MPAVTGSIPNLVNGVSQQAPAMRLPSQAEMSVNYYPTLIDGNTKRPRTNHTCVLDALPANTFTHFILRDANEKYIVAITTAGDVRVWDFAGNEKTVTNNGSAYLAGLTNAKQELRALTVADHTFIVNKTRTVAAGTAKSPARPYEALVHVLAGNYAKDYRIYINGVLEAHLLTPDGDDVTDGPYIDTVRIAGALWQLLDTGSTTWPAATTGDGGGFNTAPWAIGRYHSTIYIRNISTDFTINVEDGYSGRAMKDVKRVVQKFADLPLYAPDGFVVEVAGAEGNAADNYWVEFVKDNDANSNGVWRECVKPDTVLGLDASTMPHTLVRNSDGTFTFGPATWADRKCGDTETVSDPSFVGQPIRDVFFHKNRLGFLTQENIVLSEAGVFFNFYRKTLTALLDTDPIDVAASHTKVSLLKHVVPYQRELLVFSDETQFVLTGKELLTPKTVSADPITELSVHPDIRPVVAGSNIYFISEKDEWATVVEYYLDKALETADYETVSSHAPAYIPSGVRALIASPDLDLIIASTSGDPNSLFCYSYYWNGQEKLQSAWVKWTLPDADDIENVVFDRGLIRLLVWRDGTLFLETINAEQKVADPGAAYSTHLDRHVMLSDGVYSSLTNRTTYTLPYDAPTGLKCVTGPGGEQYQGVELPPAAIDGADVSFTGDLTGQPVRFGIPYESRYRFSRFFARDDQNRVAQQTGRTQVLHLSVVYTRSAYFRVEVSIEGRDMVTYPFNGRVISDPDNITSAIVLDDGKFSVPIMSRNDRVTIDLVNDTWLPCAFTSAEWRGTINPHSRQL
jgi:hypothetical protein